MPRSMILRRLRRIEDKLDNVLNSLDDDTLKQLEDELEDEAEEQDVTDEKDVT